jgi:hypothetical protein
VTPISSNWWNDLAKTLGRDGLKIRLQTALKVIEQKVLANRCALEVQLNNEQQIPKQLESQCYNYYLAHKL